MADYLYGMTPQGFRPKRLSDIITSIGGRLDAITDGAGQTPFQNRTDDSVIGQVVGVFSEALAECWTQASLAAAQFDPLKNSGAGQAGTVQLNAIIKKAGAPTILEMEYTGSPGTLIPAGSLIANRDSTVVFATDADVVFTSRAEVGTASCTENGPHVLAPGDVFLIQTPANGWESAVNTRTISIGTLEETEEELRIRQQRSTANTSYRQIEAIYAAVLNVPGVIFARAYQNDTLTTDERSIPAKTIAVVAEGGADRSIAEVIFKRVPLGVSYFGDVSETFVDLQGVSYVVSFQRPENVPISIDLVVKITNRGDFPDNGVALIKAAIVAYAQYGDGNSDGFPPGAEIIRSRLYTPINSVAGHEIVSLHLGTDDIPSASQNIPITWKQVGRFDIDRINVTVSA